MYRIHSDGEHLYAVGVCHDCKTEAHATHGCKHAALHNAADYK